MNKIFAPFLPPWAETGLQPAFYDVESGTVLQQTARMYDKVNQLTRLFNELSEETATTVNDYISRFTELYDYVHDYFDNLDVQEEINNKLDAMVEDGTMQEIAEAYLQPNVTWSYDTVADMKVSTSLINGTFARTSGYYDVNDGGNAIYKIRELGENETADEMFVIALTADPDSNLVAELVKEYHINAKALGIKGDGETNEYSKLNTAISSGYSIYFPAGVYLSDTTIAPTSKVDIIGDGETTVFNSYSDSPVVFPIINFTGSDDIRVKNITTTNSSFKVYNGTGTISNSNSLKHKDIYLENVLCKTVSSTVTGKTNWGLFVCNKKPDDYTSAYTDGSYVNYPIEVINHSGYNAVNINNILVDENNQITGAQDNNALGITDGATIGTALYIDMHGQRKAMKVTDNTGSTAAKSPTDYSTIQVNYNGHVSIGCAVADETGAPGTATVKLRDDGPTVSFYDTNYPDNIAKIRNKNNGLEFVANGLPRSKYLTNGYHEYSYPIRVKNLSDSHGGLILQSSESTPQDAHLYVDNHGYMRVVYTNVGTAPTGEIGYIIQRNYHGTTSNRPDWLTNDYQSIGFMYFDTTLNKPIWWKGTGWVDATGTSV